jgi:TM2 domain-containing membrane protein YozV
MSLIYCADCGKQVSSAALSCPSCGRVINAVSTKSRGVAIILALFLGGLGLHKFYLGRIGWGFVYLLFCWSFVPALVALIEGIRYALMGSAGFASKYGRT